jgi:glycosyltransferase involved in cell wall biosynthesis
MKIALASFVLQQEIGAGAATVVRHLARELSGYGHQVTIITTHTQRRLAKESVDGTIVYRFFPMNLYWVGRKDGQPRWKKVLWQLADMWNPHTFHVVRKILEYERPDLFHVHKLRGLSPALWTAAKTAQIPATIQTCHDYELMSPDGTLVSRVGQWAAGARSIVRPYQCMRSWLSRSVAAVSAPSRYTLQTLVDRGFFPYARKRVIPNSHGISLAQLDDLSSKPDRRGQGVTFLYLGRLEKTKGPLLLCEAFEQCAARDPDVHIDVAGWGSLAAEVRKRCAEHPRMRFHGRVFGSTKRDLLASCDALVVPSTYPEIFAIVVAEAYAYGKPVIASRIGGLPEIVEQDTTGYLVAPGEVASLREGLRAATANKEHLRDMRQACFAAARRFSSETVVEQYLSLYAGVLSGLH